MDDSSRKAIANIQSLFSPVLRTFTLEYEPLYIIVNTNTLSPPQPPRKTPPNPPLYPESRAAENDNKMMIVVSFVGSGPPLTNISEQIRTWSA